jgi:hypothetical protein
MASWLEREIQEFKRFYPFFLESIQPGISDAVLLLGNHAEGEQKDPNYLEQANALVKRETNLLHMLRKFESFKKDKQPVPPLAAEVKQEVGIVEDDDADEDEAVAIEGAEAVIEDAEPLNAGGGHRRRPQPLIKREKQLVIRINNAITADGGPYTNISKRQLIFEALSRSILWPVAFLLLPIIIFLMAPFVMAVALYEDREFGVIGSVIAYVLVFIPLIILIYIVLQIAGAAAAFISFFYHWQALPDKLELQHKIQQFMSRHHQVIAEARIPIAERIYGDRLKFDDLLAYQVHQQEEKVSENELQKIQDCINFFGTAANLNECPLCAIPLLELPEPYYIQLLIDAREGRQIELNGRYHVFNSSDLIRYWDHNTPHWRVNGGNKNPITREVIPREAIHAPGFPPEIEEFLLEVYEFKKAQQPAERPAAQVAAQEVMHRAPACAQGLLGRAFNLFSGARQQPPAQQGAAPGRAHDAELDPGARLLL